MAASEKVDYLQYPPEHLFQDNADLEFICEPEDFDVIPPPYPVAHLIESRIRNPQYDTPISNPVLGDADVPIGVKHAYKSGVVLPVTRTFSVFEDGDEVKYNSKLQDGQYLSWRDFPAKDDQPLVLKVRLDWSIALENGLSVLIHHPFFSDGDDHRVIPRVIDVGVGIGPHPIECELHIENPGFTLRFGEPLVQIQPFRNRTCQLNAEVLPAESDN